MQRAAASLRASAALAGRRAAPLSNAAASASAHFTLATAGAWRSPLCAQQQQPARGICSRAVGVAQRAEQAQRARKQQHSVVFSTDSSMQLSPLHCSASTSTAAVGAAGASGAAGAGAATPVHSTPVLDTATSASSDIVSESVSAPIQSFSGPLNPDSWLSWFPEKAQVSSTDTGAAREETEGARQRASNADVFTLLMLLLCVCRMFCAGCTRRRVCPGGRPSCL